MDFIFVMLLVKSVSDFLANKSCLNQSNKQTPPNKGKTNTITNTPFCFTSVHIHVLQYRISADVVT